MSDWARLADVEYWWSSNFPGAFYYGGSEERRLYAAFREVLVALPDDQFQVFRAAQSTVVCLPGVNAAVFRHHVAVPPRGQTPEVNVLYFSPTVFRRKDSALLRLVAHEVAHVVLGHYGAREAGSARTETAANALARQWGFRPAHTPSLLDRVRREEARLRRRRERRARRRRARRPALHLRAT